MGTWSGAEEAEKAPPDVSCPICKGAGFVYADVPVGHPDFGKALPCRCIREESNRERLNRLQRYSNLGSLARFTFDKLEPEGISGDSVSQQQFKRAYEAAGAFANDPKGWFILVGHSGSGKTCLAAAITNECLNHGCPAFYISAPDLLYRLRAAFSPDSEMPYSEFFDQVRNAPLLVLDDLGAQASTPWVKEKLDQLLTHRFNSELPTVIVTITPVDQLEDRIRTRLTDPDLCHTWVIEGKQTKLEYGWGPEFELQKTMTFDKFEKRVNLPLEQQENLAEAFRVAVDFAKSPEGWVVFMGVTGCGKTHLAAAIANYRYQAGKSALFVVVPEFLDHLRSTFSPDSKVSYDRLFESVKTAPLLILDDFGEQSTTSWAREKLYQIISYRYNARLATVITTRYSLDEILEEIEVSISSRLVDMKISNPFNIMAPDYRGDKRSSQRPRRSRRSRKDY